MIPHNLNVNEQNFALIDDEVVKKLNIGANEESEHDEVNEFISNIFLVRKKNGRFSIVSNLKKTKPVCWILLFITETLQHVANLLKRNAYFGSIDLENAYFSIPIRQNSKRHFLNLNGEIIYIILNAYHLVSRMLQEF